MCDEMKYSIADFLLASFVILGLGSLLALMIAEARSDRRYEFEQIHVADKWSRAKNTPAIRTGSGRSYTVANMARIEEDKCYQIALELGSYLDTSYDGKVVAYKQISCGDVK
jgi:L,D-peptidoglycan transpeptidase YkuD (ErfK/YbiS/YcfS/YnhG family)